MARIPSGTSIRHFTAFHLRSSKPRQRVIPLDFYRHRSSKALLSEIELDSSSSSDGGQLSDLLALKKFDDMIHRIIVHKATPDWLPFVPGSSFWVPPRRGSSKIVDLVEKLSNQLTEEESLSLTTLRGWPCSSFLLEECGSTQTLHMEVSVSKEEGLEVKVLTDSENTSEKED